MFRNKSGVTVVSVSEDGLTTVYIRNNKRFTVTRSTAPSGFYPGGSRAAAYRGGTDRRHSREVTEMVRDMRRDGKMGRHVKPGPQSWRS